MSKVKITDLPSEILVKIFLLLDSWEIDLLALTETCKKFNNVIGSSVKLMNKLSVNWDEDEPYRIILNKSTRKYNSIFLNNLSKINRNLLRFIQFHTFNLSYLGLNDCSLNSSEFGKLLNRISEHLQNLSLCGINFTQDELAYPIDFPKLNDLELLYGEGDGYSVVYDYFKRSKKLKIFSVEDIGEPDSFETRKFYELISSFASLESLNICHYIAQKLFKNNIYSEFLGKIRLKTFYMWMNGPEQVSSRTADTLYYNNLMTFLSSFTSTLTELSLVYCTITPDFLERLLQLKGIKYLTILLSSYSNFFRSINVENTSVEKLSLGTQYDRMDLIDDIEDTGAEIAICSILKCCKNIKELDLRMMKVSFEVSMTINNHVENLRKIKFYDCEVPPFTYHNVITMELDMNVDDVIKLIRVNKQLKKIKFPSSVQHHRKYSTALEEMDLEKVELLYFD